MRKNRSNTVLNFHVTTTRQQDTYHQTQQDQNYTQQRRRDNITHTALHKISQIKLIPKTTDENRLSPKNRCKYKIIAICMFQLVKCTALHCF